MIEVSHISKAYGKKQVLQDISFLAACGEQVSVIGRNGCGKSTMMQILAGLSRPDGGSLTCFGHDMLRERKEFRRFTGYVPQDNPLMEELTVRDNLSLWTGKKGDPEAWLREEFELGPILRTRVSELSGGMKRRVSIACAAAQNPPILLMDEPTTALDYFFRDSIHAWMRRFRERNGILILTTHDDREIAMSSKCFRMDGGVLYPA